MRFSLYLNFSTEIDRLCWGLHVREIGVIGNFPEKAVRVREITCIPAPIRWLRGFHDFGAKC